MPAAFFAMAAGLAALPAQGHDFWIEPDRLMVPAGTRIAVSLRVGDAFAGEPVARNPRLVERFAALGPRGESPITGTAGRHPAGAFAPASPGRYWLLYRSRPSPVTLAAEAFEAYLAEEGLDHVLAARRAQGAQGEPGRELFSRCAKTLVQVGAGVGAGDGDLAAAVTRPSGLDLDLVPETDPLALSGGGELEIRLLFRGEPLAAALLQAHGPGGRRLAARTDAAGRVTFDLDAAGGWLITGVHMVEAAAGSGADWESLWASLRFDLPAA